MCNEHLFPFSDIVQTKPYYLIEEKKNILNGNNHKLQPYTEVLYRLDPQLFILSHSNHVLTEDIIFREVTPTNCLLSRRLLTKTSRAPRWMERYLPKHMASSAYIIEDSIVDPQKRTMTTLTWNISHARLMVPQCLLLDTLSIAQSNNMASCCFCLCFPPCASRWKSGVSTELTLRTAAGQRFKEKLGSLPMSMGLLELYRSVD